MLFDVKFDVKITFILFFDVKIDVKITFILLFDVKFDVKIDVKSDIIFLFF